MALADGGGVTVAALRWRGAVGWHSSPHTSHTAAARLPWGSLALAGLNPHL